MSVDHRSLIDRLVDAMHRAFFAPALEAPEGRAPYREAPTREARAT
jgi:hypothetical protein